MSQKTALGGQDLVKKKVVTEVGIVRNDPLSTSHETTYDHTTYITQTAITTHEGAVDPHTGYQKESEKGVASGYASLEADIKVTVAQLRNPVWIGVTAPDPTEYPLWLDIS